MAARVYGQSVGTARRAGATPEQQAAYGLTSAAIEVASEMLFDGVAKIYGAGAADGIVEKLVVELAESDTGRGMLRFLAGAGGEGAEEVVSDLLSPLAEATYRDESLAELYRQLEPADLLYDYLIGASVSILASGASAVTGSSVYASPEYRANEAEYFNILERNGRLESKNAAPDGTADKQRANSAQESNSENGSALQRRRSRAIIFTKISDRGEVLNPMPDHEYIHLKEILNSQGVEVFAAESGDDLRYMMSFGAEGTYSNGRITHIGKIPSRGTLYEEIIHLAQARKYGELDSTDHVELYAREIEANRLLLENKDELNLDESDVADIVRNLAQWEKLFEQVRGESYDESCYRDNS